MSESRETELIEAIIDNLDDSETEYTKTPQSRNEEILVSILNETEYTKTPQSREEELLLELKEKIKTASKTTVEPLSVTANGTYTAEEGKAFSPVNVDIAANAEFIVSPNGVFSFQQCVKKITIPDGITTISEGFKDSSLEEINLPNSVTTITYPAFYGCAKLDILDLPSSITSIYKAAFSGTHLKKLIVRAETPPVVTGGNFENFPALARILVLSQSVDTYKNDTVWGSFAMYIRQIGNYSNEYIDVAEWDFSDSSPLVDKINGYQLQQDDVTFSDGVAVFSESSSSLWLPNELEFFYDSIDNIPRFPYVGIEYEINIKEVTGVEHGRRLIQANAGVETLWQFTKDSSTEKWNLYLAGYYYTDLTDISILNGSKLTIKFRWDYGNLSSIGVNLYGSVYLNDELVVPEFSYLHPNRSAQVALGGGGSKSLTMKLNGLKVRIKRDL